MTSKFALHKYVEGVPEPQDLTEADCDREPLPGVYVLYGSEGNVVYVGQSNDCARRVWRQHVKDKEFSCAEVYHEFDDSSRLRLEGILILALGPDLNKGLYLGLKRGRCWEIRWSTAARASRKKRTKRKN